MGIYFLPGFSRVNLQKHHAKITVQGSILFPGFSRVAATLAGGGGVYAYACVSARMYTCVRACVPARMYTCVRSCVPARGIHHQLIFGRLELIGTKPRHC